MGGGGECPECPDYSHAPYSYGVEEVEADNAVDAFKKKLQHDYDGYSIDHPHEADADPDAPIPRKGILWLPQEEGECIYEIDPSRKGIEPLMVGVVCEEIGSGDVFIGEYSQAVSWVLRDAAAKGIQEVTLQP